MKSEEEILEWVKSLAIDLHNRMSHSRDEDLYFFGASMAFIIMSRFIRYSRDVEFPDYLTARKIGLEAIERNKRYAGSN